MYFVRPIHTTLPLLGLFLLAGCSTGSVLEQSQAAERRGDWQRAFSVINEEYQTQSEQGAVDEALAQRHERLKREALRDRAQTLIFREREDEAMTLLDELASLDPDFRDLDKLRLHAKRKQAKALADAGDRLLSEQEFQLAMEKYLESQRVDASLDFATTGIERVKEELARMDAVAQRQFLQAVRKYPEFRHVEVAWHADAVIRNSPDLEDERRANALRLRDQARVERARATFAEAEASADEDKFGAALVLYRQALQLDPEFEEAKAGVDKMNEELAALGLIESAQLIMRNGGFEKAQEMLKQAFEMSQLSRGAISELMIENRRLQAGAEYRAARDFEVMGKKAEAVAAFEALLAKWPDGFEDEAARIDALKIDIAGAAAEWQAALDAEAAGDLEKAIGHYRDAQRFYKAWRDADAEIARIQRALSGEGEEPAGGEEPTTGEAPAGAEAPTGGQKPAGGQAPSGGDQGGRARC